jgi:hypothetical protein
MPGIATKKAETKNFSASSSSVETKTIKAPPKNDVKKAATKSASCSLVCELHGKQAQIVKREIQTS